MTDAALSPMREPARALQSYYFLRAGVAAAWVVAAFTLGAANPVVAGVLLVLYPAWDAFANLRDAQANGGLRANPSQALNLVVSAAVAIAVGIALQIDLHLVLALFGGWAFAAGLLQLVTGVRRWGAYGAQWAMILSGAQSALAGVFFVIQSGAPTVAPITAVAPYAAFGAFYFLVSAIVLAVKGRKR